MPGNDDTQSLGDWTENEKKLPGGLKRLSEKIRALGIDFDSGMYFMEAEKVL